MAEPKNETIANPQLVIRISHYEWKMFKELKKKGFSARKVLEYVCSPCNDCDKDFIVAKNEDGEIVNIPRGIIIKK